MIDTNIDALIVRVRATFAGRSLQELTALEQDVLGLCNAVELRLKREDDALANLKAERKVYEYVINRFIDAVARRD